MEEPNEHYSNFDFLNIFYFVILSQTVKIKDNWQGYSNDHIQHIMQ